MEAVPAREQAERKAARPGAHAEDAQLLSILRQRLDAGAETVHNSHPEPQLQTAVQLVRADDSPVPMGPLLLGLEQGGQGGATLRRGEDRAGRLPREEPVVEASNRRWPSPARMGAGTGPRGVEAPPSSSASAGSRCSAAASSGSGRRSSPAGGAGAGTGWARRELLADPMASTVELALAFLVF